MQSRIRHKSSVFSLFEFDFFVVEFLFGRTATFLDVDFDFSGYLIFGAFLIGTDFFDFLDKAVSAFVLFAILLIAWICFLDYIHRRNLESFKAH